MQTHLEKIEGLENWQAWAGAGVGHFIRVRHGEHREVMLSRWDVHTMLESATETVFSTPGSGGRTTYTRGFSVARGGTGITPVELVVRKPGSAGEWMQELITLGESGTEKLFQVGTWVVRVGPPDYYAHIVASTDEAAASAYRAGGDDYKAMYLGSSGCKDKTAALLGFLQGDPLVGTPPEMARLCVAMCVSEAARNHRTWGINLMLLDLLRQNAVPGGFGAVIQNEMHPMSKGGTYQPGKVGMKGGRKSRETWAHETGITMLWLSTFAGVRADMVDGSERRWRDPVKGEAFSGVVRGRLTDALVTRFRKVGWAWG
ncbi:hypothetical protein [Polyangium sorediatum]|uniref:Uncharacterized protein n=1 Tax=Polyangium sorediatum TaxID=889274 RepID=A0ABT6P9L4_9BACT|nr:hypothetical protein [Polyangium sorediatum]MDI1437316.1 hypothetical protein [Polyangium sorediatum]